MSKRGFHGFHHAASSSSRSQKWHEEARSRHQHPRARHAVDGILAITGCQVEEEPLWLCGRRGPCDKGRHNEGGAFSGKPPITSDTYCIIASCEQSQYVIATIPTQDVSRALSFLRKSEAQTDLRFVMAESTSKSKRKDGPSGEIVLAHKAIFARHSSLMRNIFDIAEKKQVQ